MQKQRDEATVTTASLPPRVEASDPLGREATQLLSEMTAEAVSRYKDVRDVSAPPPTNEPLVARSVFLIAWIGSMPVGCAALRPIELHIAEVRRMYVRPTFRRHGLARLLLEELEARAAVFGFRTLRLETGNRQPEAIALYESAGFRRIPPYGHYVGDPLSICFEKGVTR